MRFWDSSAVIPLVFKEPASEALNDLLMGDAEITVWWGTWAECAVAISHLKREGGVGDDAEQEARVALDRLAADWTEIRPLDELRFSAMLVSIDHHLKAADCLQLAAALRWCEGDTNDKGFVCLDERLRRAASDEGFDVLLEREEEPS